MPRPSSVDFATAATVAGGGLARTFRAVRERLVVGSREQADETKKKQAQAAELREARAAQTGERLRRQSERRKQAKARQVALTRTFGNTTLDDDGRRGRSRTPAHVVLRRPRRRRLRRGVDADLHGNGVRELFLRESD